MARGVKQGDMKMRSRSQSQVANLGHYSLSITVTSLVLVEYSQESRAQLVILNHRSVLAKSMG